MAITKNNSRMMDPIVSTGSTTARALSDRFADTVNVKDFGAVGDGVTDDTAAFSAAAVTGNVIFVPAGTYVISSNITGVFYSFGDVTITGGIVDKIANIKNSPKIASKQPPLFSLSSRYSGLKNAWYTTVDTGLFEYNAFPFFWVGNSKLHAISWSSGIGHANSDYKRYAIIDPDTHEMQKGVFFDETLPAEDQYDFSWLEPYLEEGEYVNFRSAYTVIRENGILNRYVNSTVLVSGDTYALWGTPYQYNGDWYTGGYRTVGGYWRPALFKSTDKMKTWSFVSLVASNSARQYNEAAFLNTSGSNFISVVRDDKTDAWKDIYGPDPRDLVLTTSTNGGTTWADLGTILPVIPDVKGTQPFLMKLSDGRIMLLAGKRTGSSGIHSGGSLAGHVDDSPPIDLSEITGVAYWISDDDGATWSPSVQIAPSWSTDCGNPSAKQLPNGNVAVAFYTAQGATNGTEGVEPSIIYMEFDPVNTLTNA